MTQAKQRADVQVGDFQPSGTITLSALVRGSTRARPSRRKVAQHDAETAAAYADFTIDFAFWAVEETEYAVRASRSASSAFDSI